VVAVGAGLRLWYFGDPLPNTYYLKVAGIPLLARLTRGLAGVGVLALSVGGALLLGAVMASTWTHRELAPALTITAGQVAYSIFVGGDAWEDSLPGDHSIVIAIAPVLVLVAGGLWRSALLVTRRLGIGATGSRQARRPAVGILACLVCLTWMTLCSWRNTSILSQALLLERPSHTVGNLSHVRTAWAIRRFTTKDAAVAVAWAGVVPYFSGRRGVDLLGMNDPVVAPRCKQDAPWLPGRVVRARLHEGRLRSLFG